MEIRVIGVDIAKHVLQINAADTGGRMVAQLRLRRANVLDYFANLQPCLVGMEACATAHHWAREIQALRHEVRLMPPGYVKPYVKRNKTDAADAEAIAEAETRPTMRFVAVKSIDQQAALLLHRAREHRRRAAASSRGLARKPTSSHGGSECTPASDRRQGLSTLAARSPPAPGAHA